MSRIQGERAVVLGAGMAGLLTARVLADRYRQVVIVERDPQAEIGENRKGVPQGRHAHALLARGQRILEDLFPGLQQELTDAGIYSCDLAENIRWYFNGTRLQPSESGLLSVSATRPQLEGYVRERVIGMDNVELRDCTVVNGLEVTPERDRVIGVQVTGVADGAQPEVLSADLVVDTTGRGSRTPAWLEELGYERPEEEKIKVDLAYTTRLYKLGSDPYHGDFSINTVARPENPRGAFFCRLDENTAMLSLTGLLGDHPPRDDAGFLEFTKSLDAKEIYQTVKDSTPVDDPVTFHVPASIRRRFDKLSRFPEGYLVLGDGVCSFNPVYGQGMTVAAMEAIALGEHLDNGPVRPLEFFKEQKPIVDVPWEISTGGDFAFPGVEGKRTLKAKMGNAYISRLHTAAQVNGKFTAAFFRVAGLVDPPEALMKPGLIVGVLRTARAKRKSAAAAR